MTPRMFRDIRDASPSLNIRHLRDVRDEIRMTVFAFSHLNPPAAERYLSGLDSDAVGQMRCRPSWVRRAHW
jgi:hypothetical protein